MEFAMSIDLRWNADRTIFILKFQMGWTWHEYEHLYLQAKQEIAGMSHDVYSIWDLAQRGTVPMSALSKLRSYQKRGMPPNFKGVIMVTQRLFLRSMIDVYNRSLGKHTHQVTTANSVAEAEQIIAVRIGYAGAKR